MGPTLKENSEYVPLEPGFHSGVRWPIGRLYCLEKGRVACVVSVEGKSL